jgi:hypothetical protein
MDKESHCNVVMLDHERKLKVEPEQLLRQIEEGLAHSRGIIAQIDNVRRGLLAGAKKREGASRLNPPNSRAPLDATHSVEATPVLARFV